MMNRFQMSDIDKTANIHFIGIGGISMSGLKTATPFPARTGIRVL